ncbi:MAG: D-aminoacyl-tRNA deacylase [Mycoplasmatales bacterium]
MKVIIQNVLSASVLINKEVYNEIENGYMILVAFGHDDDKMIVQKMVEKIIKLRIIQDENDKMNLSIVDVKGSILSISQFTLYANTKKGNRPSFGDSMNPKDSKDLYDYFNDLLSKHVKVSTGIFGADMKVSLINNGPITINLEM